MLKPSLLQTSKNSSQQPFGTEHRKNPFPVKEEHATVCSHIDRSSALRSSLGTMTRQKRETSHESIKNARPGPADYNTIDLHANSRPMTAQKSYSIAK